MAQSATQLTSEQKVTVIIPNAMHAYATEHQTNKYYIKYNNAALMILGLARVTE